MVYQTIFGAQIRGARAMVGWSQTELANEAGVAQKTVERFEASSDPLTGRAAMAVAQALQAAGISFTVLEEGFGIVLTVPGRTSERGR